MSADDKNSRSRPENSVAEFARLKATPLRRTSGRVVVWNRRDYQAGPRVLCIVAVVFRTERKVVDLKGEVDRMPDFLPRADAALHEFVKRFVAQTNARPEVFAVPDGVREEINALATAFLDAYAVWQHPATHTRGPMLLKDAARTAVKAKIRKACHIFRGLPQVTDDDLMRIGCRPRLTTRKRPSRLQTAPADVPYLDVIAHGFNQFTVAIRTFAPHGRVRPNGTACAVLLSAVAESPPLTLDGYTFAGNAGRRTHTIHYDADLPLGTTIWVRACWVGRNGGLGPASAAVGVHAGTAPRRVA